MDNKKSGLGKGLSALFTETNIDVDNIESKEERTNLFEIEIDSITVNPYQPRSEFEENALNELSDSIKQFGVIQPVTVSPSSDGSGYVLISGERRIRAAIRAGLKSIPAYIKPDESLNPERLLEIALIENVQRQDLNPMELSDSYKRLIDELGLTQEQVAAKVSKQRSTVANYLRLQKLPEEIKQSLRKGEITEAHARTILRAATVEEQLKLWKQVLEGGVTVRELEGKTSAKQKKKKGKQIAEWNPFFEKLEEKMRRFFGTRAKVNSKTNNSGEIIIEYYSNEDLERILDKLEQ